MTPGQVCRSLRVLRDRFSDLLEPTARSILDEAIAQVNDSYQLYQKQARARRSGSWGYTISPDKPLQFTRSTIDSINLQPDIFCEVRWAHSDDAPVEQALVLRVWSLDKFVVFRPNLDAADVLNQLSAPTRRVMLRYHFDLANFDQPGPRYHLQAGGNARDDELCWLHEAVSVPRIAHPPMDLFLACEMVAANFHGPKGQTVLRDPTWLGTLRLSQEHFLKKYFENCLRAIESESSLLENLWNRSWS